MECGNYKVINYVISYIFLFKNYHVSNLDVEYQYLIWEVIVRYVQHPNCLTVPYQLFGYILQYSFIAGILNEGLAKRDQVGHV